jgi:glutamine synthetase
MDLSFSFFGLKLILFTELLFSSVFFFAEDLQSLRSRLEAEGVRHVRLLWVDWGNTIRTKMVPISRFFKLLVPGSPVTGISLSNIFVCLPAFGDVPLPELPPYLTLVGEMSLVPEIGTIVRLPYGTRTHAACLVNLEEKDDGGLGGSGKELDLCPRTVLRRILKYGQWALDYFLGIKFLDCSNRYREFCIA